MEVNQYQLINTNTMLQINSSYTSCVGFVVHNILFNVNFMIKLGNRI